MSSTFRKPSFLKSGSECELYSLKVIIINGFFEVSILCLNENPKP